MSSSPLESNDNVSFCNPFQELLGLGENFLNEENQRVASLDHQNLVFPSDWRQRFQNRERLLQTSADKCLRAADQTGFSIEECARRVRSFVDSVKAIMLWPQNEQFRDAWARMRKDSEVDKRIQFLREEIDKAENAKNQELADSLREDVLKIPFDFRISQFKAQKVPAFSEALANYLTIHAQRMMECGQDLRELSVRLTTPASREKQPCKKKTRGRKSDTDHAKDKKVFEAWKSEQYSSYSELAGELNIREREVKLAIDRHRKRLERKSLK